MTHTYMITDCISGWTGNDCLTDVDDCVGHRCFGGATCVDGIGYYTCVCPPGRTGNACLHLHVSSMSFDWLFGMPGFFACVLADWSDCRPWETDLLFYVTGGLERLTYCLMWQEALRDWLTVLCDWRPWEIEGLEALTVCLLTVWSS